MSKDTVLAICALHREALLPFPQKVSLSEFLAKQADLLWRGHREKDPRVQVQISNWHPHLVAKPVAEVMAHPFSQEDGKLTIAKEYGFENWDAVTKVQPQAFNVSFENAVDAVVNGNLSELQSLLDREPNLVTTASQFGHRATLLHYVAANGVETWRQQVPANALEVTRCLIERGADVRAHAQVYGGGQTTMALLLSSAHPEEAGLTEPIAKLLHAAGG